MTEPPAIEHVRARTAEELIDILRPEKWEATWVFRGQRDAEWALVPSAMRPPGLVEPFPPGIDFDHPEHAYAATHVHREWSAVYEFARMADRIGLDALLTAEAQEFERHMVLGSKQGEPFCSFPPNLKLPPNNLLDLFALAQHHGVPTRLIDWTSNSFTAAFFAAQDVVAAEALDIDAEFAIWCLDTTAVEGENFPYYDIFPPAPFSYFTTSYHRQIYQRVQRGGFTVDDDAARHYSDHGSWISHDGLIAEWWSYFGEPASSLLGGPPLKKVTVPSSAAENTLRILARYDITLADLMPTLDNVAKMLWPSRRRRI